METMRHEAYEITQCMDWVKASVFALIPLRRSSNRSLVRNITPPLAGDSQVSKEFLAILYHFGSGGCKGVVVGIVNSTWKVLLVIEGEVFNPKIVWEEVCHDASRAVSIRLVFFVGGVSVFRGYPGSYAANVEGEGVISPILEDARGWMVCCILVPPCTPGSIPPCARRQHRLVSGGLK
jgi:hypothetical protein